MNCLKNGKQGRQFSESIRCFCLTLFYHSVRAYTYVRSKFGNTLPSISAIRNWYSSIDGSPGFTAECFDALENLANQVENNGEELLCNVILDEMSIRRHSSFNIWSKEYEGFVDLGKPNPDQGPVPLAKDALVYMVSGVNKNFKIPVAYFYINGLAADEKSAITGELLRRLHSFRVKVVSIIFDGPKVNISMANYLGADFESNQAYITDPNDSTRRIFIILDACHMLKLSRNCFATYTLYDGEGKKIEWRYIEMLYKIQNELNWNFGNKLTKTHMQWNKKKMNVKLAAQTMSASVADSLEFLKNERPEFEEVDATVQFIRIINDVFDVMNSTEKSHVKNNIYKQPLSTETEKESFKLFLQAINYMNELKIDYKGKIIPILSSERHTAFFGFIHNMENFMKIYDDYVATGRLNVLYTHRMSQDLLETFFGCIRGMNGRAENPITSQFQSAWRKLCVHNEVVCSQRANCIDKGTKILTVSSHRLPKYKKTTLPTVESDFEFDQLEDQFEFDQLEDQFESYSSLHSILDDGSIDNLQEHISAYMASLVEEKIVTAKGSRVIVKCQECTRAFVENEVIDNRFIEFKFRQENILKPCISTVNICKMADSFIIQASGVQAKYGQVLLRIMRNLPFHSLYPSTNFHYHDETNHKYNFIKSVVETYLNLKSIHLGKTITLDAHVELIRSDLTKQIHRSGQ